MKGFPNQFVELPKLAAGMRCLTDLVDGGSNPKDDGIYGPALVRARVAGTRHTPMSAEEYIRDQLTKEPSNQSFRTTARGLRELYRLMRLIDDSGAEIQVTALGRRAAAFTGLPMDSEQIDFWRRVIRNMTHRDDHGLSHPYQVLLRLVARKPGITRAKCALALEARDDSPEQLDHIVALSDLPEDTIRARIDVTKSNWDNAKKVLPRFAEQLGDVICTGQSFVIADAPGRADEGAAEEPDAAVGMIQRRTAGVRAPRSSREVTEQTIGRAGIAEQSDEVEIPTPEVDPTAAAEGIRRRAARLRRHNLLVREFAARLQAAGAQLYEDPFDILALVAARGILVEVKTLDGTDDDERDRVRDALAQLLYYEVFVTRPIAGEATIRKVACFEHKISGPHIAWLNRQGIAVIWKENGTFTGDELAGDFLGRYLDEFR